jgi:CelD/BcsL family acetyltransferase involved in cellulose biosynthesis
VTPADIAAWRALSERAAEPNPFFEPDFVLPAHRALGGQVRLLVVEQDGRWSGCLPVRRLFPGVLRSWRHSYCFLGTPLVDAAAVRQTTSEMLGAARLLILDAQHGEGPVAMAIGAALRERGMTPFYERAQDRAALHRRPEADYLDGMNAHHRREFRRQRRRLEEQLGDALEVRDVSDDVTAPARFVTLEAAGWKGRGGTAFGSQPGHAEFFEAVCAAFRASGRLQMLEMTADERTVAMKCNLIAGDGVFCFKIAHDELLSRYSPGVQLEIAYVECFHDDRDEAWADSCAAHDNQMINRLWPDRRSIVTLGVSRTGPEAAVFRQAAHSYQTLRTRRRSEPSPASWTSTSRSSPPASAAHPSPSPTR